MAACRKIGILKTLIVLYLGYLLGQPHILKISMAFCQIWVFFWVTLILMPFLSKLELYCDIYIYNDCNYVKNNGFSFLRLFFFMFFHLHILYDARDEDRNICRLPGSYSSFLYHNPSLW